jgi:hypothetical protein
MLASKEAPFFHIRFQEFLIEEFKDEVDNTKGKNEGFTNERPVTHQVLAEQLGALLERICE